MKQHPQLNLRTLGSPSPSRMMKLIKPQTEHFFFFLTEVMTYTSHVIFLHHGYTSLNTADQLELIIPNVHANTQPNIDDQFELVVQNHHGYSPIMQRLLLGYTYHLLLYALFQL